ncbi:MAG: lasso RiPP family leader peptide-containing protein [Novosphingobium sp.]
MSQTNFEVKPESPLSGKAEYSAPRLVIYGNVSELTMAQSGSNFESVVKNNGSKSKPG